MHEELPSARAQRADGRRAPERDGREPSCILSGGRLTVSPPRYREIAARRAEYEEMEAMVTSKAPDPTEGRVWSYVRTQ
jgi:hypothetical protein